MKTNLQYATLIALVSALTACGGSGGSDGGTVSSSSVASQSSSSVSSVSSSSVSSNSESSSSQASSESSASESSSSDAANDNPWQVSTEHLYQNASFPVGVAVSAGNESYSLFADSEAGEKRRDIVTTHFSNMTAGNIMKMSYLQPNEGQFTFANADELVNFAATNGQTIHGHVLVWHSDYQVPGWMKNYSGDWDTMLRAHINGVVTHFAAGGTVPSWDVVNEAFNDDGSYRDGDSVFYQNMGEGYIEIAFDEARKADPNAELYYNDYSLAQGGAKLNAVLAMAEDFIARDVPIDGIGFQGHIQIDWPSASAIEQSFAAAADTGLKVRLTELDIPLNNPYSSGYDYPGNYEAEFTAELAAKQKRRYCDVVTAYMNAVPEAQRGGVSVWGIEDPSSWLISLLFDNQHDDWPLLFDADYHAKPALDGVADALSGQPCS